MMKRLKFGWVVLLAMLLATLTGCPRPLTTLAGGGAPLGEAQRLFGEPVPLQGRALLDRGQRQTQATFADVVTSAVVSVIDTVTNVTIASTVTGADGSFTFSKLKPTPDRTYYLEVFKGLPVDGAPNRAGKPSARIRTIAVFSSSLNKWQSLAAGDIVYVDEGTTALSVIMSLRSAAPVRPVESLLIGSLVVNLVTPKADVFTAGASNVTVPEFQAVQNKSWDAIAGDMDPLGSMTFDLDTSQFYLAQKGISIAAVTPTVGSIGTNVRIDGQNLTTTPVVKFNGQTAVVSVSWDQAIIQTQVPPGGSSGAVTVTVGSVVYMGAYFSVRNWDGHNVFDSAGNMYVAGHYDGGLWKVTPEGEVSIAASASFGNPRGIVVDAWNNVYLTSWDQNKIYQVAPGGAVTTYATGSGLNNPWGLAINTAGDIFVANYGGGNILKVASGSAAVSVYATGGGITRPSRIAFDLAGYMYMTDWSTGKVVRIAPGGATIEDFAFGFSSPGGIALDSQGYVYMAANGNAWLYRIAPNGNVSQFLSLEYSDSVAFHPDGTIYLSSYGYPYIARVNSSGRVLNYISPGHLTQSIATDTSRDHLYVTSGQGWGSRASLVSRATWNPATSTYGMLSPWAKGVPNPSALAVHPVTNDVYIGDWSGVIWKADKNTGEFTSYVAGIKAPSTGGVSAMCFNSTGTKLYASCWGTLLYEITAGAITRTWGKHANRSYGAGYVGNITKGPDGWYYLADYYGDSVYRTLNGVTEWVVGGITTPMCVAFAANGTMYVSSYGGDYIARVDPVTKAVTNYKSMSTNPNGLLFDASDNLYVACGNGPPSVRKIATGSLTVTTVASTPTGTWPWGLARNPANGDLYVADESNIGAIYKIDGGTSAISTYSMQCVNPMGLFFDTSNSDLYVGSYGDGMLKKISSGGALTVINNHGSVSGVYKEASGDVLWSRWDSTMRLWKQPSGTSNKYQVGEAFYIAASLAMDPTDRYLYVGTYGSGTISKIDTQDTANKWTMLFNSQYTHGNSYTGLWFQPDGSLYAECWSSGIRKYNLATIGYQSAVGETFIGGDKSSAGFLGNVAIGKDDRYYGTTWSWGRNGSSPVTSMSQAGLASTVEAHRVPIWPAFIQY